MKFLFIYPDVGGRSLNFSPAIEILSSYLKQQGVDVSLIHLNDEVSGSVNVVKTNDFEEIYNRVKKFSPDVIGVTATTFQYPVACDVAKDLKRRGWNKLIILGGIHATIAPYDLETSPFDAFSIGEGELTLSELMHRLEKGEDITNIKGLNVKIDNKVIDNGYPNVIENLDELPERDYEIMDTKQILKISNGWFSTAFSRGCPYACKFCINQKLRKDYIREVKGKYYRCQSVQKVIRDLLSYINAYPEIKVFNFDDDLLIMDKKWFKEFATEYKEKIYDKYGIVYVINTRANLVNEEVARLLKESGCYECQVGFETGNEELRNKVLSKEITNEQLRTAFGLFNQYKVRALAYTMIGIPDESKESLKETIKMLSELKPTLIRMTFFEPYIGTPLYDYCIENELFDDEFGNKNNFTKSMVKLKNISNEELVRTHLLFPWYMNLELDLEESIKTRYQMLIQEYSDINEDVDLVEVKKEIIEKDRIISNELIEKEISHFSYFVKNTNYFNYSNFAN